MSRRVRLLIDECLHTSLVKVATDRLYEAYHVAHLGMSGLKDHELMLRIRDEDFTLVTNNAIDFRRLFRKERVHSGLVILVPNVPPTIQRALFETVLDYIGDSDLAFDLARGDAPAREAGFGVSRVPPFVRGTRGPCDRPAPRILRKHSLLLCKLWTTAPEPR